MLEEIEEYEKGSVNVTNLINCLIRNFKRDNYSLNIDQCRLVINYLLSEKEM